MKLKIILLILIVVLSAAGGFLVWRMNSNPKEQPSATRDEAATVVVTSVATPDEPAATEPTTEPEIDRYRAAVEKVEEMAGKQLKNKSKKLDVEELYQLPELPTGCESVALTAARRYLGFDIEKTEIADNYLIYDDDMFLGFVGDPHGNEGAGIFPPGLTETANNYLADKESDYIAVNTMGYSVEELRRFIDNGCPVLVWTTMSFYEPNIIGGGMFYDDEEYYWYDNEHCMALIGYDTANNELTFCDPLNGIVTCDADHFEWLYDDIGKLSMTIVECKQNENK